MFKTDEFKEIRLLSIDPGLNNIGLGFYRVDVDRGEVISISSYTLKSNRVRDVCGLDDSYPEQIIKRKNMMASLSSAIEDFQPDIVACESPFFDRRKPGSYGILVEVLSSIQETIINYDPRVRLHLVEPLLVKKLLGVAGQKGKEVVYEAFIQYEPIVSKLKDHLEHLSEHAIDAIAVGYAWLTYKSDILKKESV